MKDEVRRKKAVDAIKLPGQAGSQMKFGNEEKGSGVAADLRATAPQLKETDDGHGMPLQPKGMVARRSTATTENNAPSKASEAMLQRWKRIRAGEMPPPGSKPKPPRRSENPLLDLPEEQRAKLFAWLRECPYDDHVQQMLRDQGMAEATPWQLGNFFQVEAEGHWEKRIGRAAEEANALVRLVEKSPVRFSAGILAALGQEAFRQIASGQVEPDAMGKLATLFLKARSDERADQMQELKREKLRHELQGQVDHALEKLAEEVDRHPKARMAFEALRRELEGLEE
jgi:hypothetical protein